MSRDQLPRGADSPDEAVGETLHRLRRDAGLTGQELGRRVRMSQAKISRIETGSTTAVPEDVGLIARSLGAPADEVERLVELAERSQNRMTDWRQTSSGVAFAQRDIAGLETRTTELRVFQPAVIIGLMQTSEYARSILTSAHESRRGIYREQGTADVPAAVAARLHRQESLADPDKQFHFVMTESALRNHLVPPEHMLAQMNRLREVGDLPNVSLRIIPADATLTMPPYHGFEVLDAECVFFDAFNTTLLTRGQEDVQLYRRVFDLLEANATSDVGPVFDHYRRSYLAEIRDQA